MSTTTNNLGLTKLELTDPADITALNPNWDKIDAKFGKEGITELTEKLKDAGFDPSRTINLTREEYNRRLANYQANSNYIDPNSGKLFSETLYNVTDDYVQIDGDLIASSISYTDTNDLGANNVQDAIDAVTEMVKRVAVELGETTTFDANGTVTTVYSDGSKEITETKSDGSIVTTYYDAQGNVTKTETTVFTNNSVTTTYTEE